MSCSNFDAAYPGTGPIGHVSAKAPSVEFEKYTQYYNYSLKSKSDNNKNPQPEGNVYSAYPKAETNRTGVYAIETDRGELSPTSYTQVNVTGQKQFRNRLQDEVRPTMKETTLYSYDGNVAPVNQAQAEYSQFIPQYKNINGKTVRVSGASNFGLKSATEYSYFAGAAPTGINGQSIQNPDSAIGKNTKQVADYNVSGPGTFQGALPDAGRFQQYRTISTPTTNGLKLNYNLETQPKVYSELIGKEIKGTESRFTSSYQIAPLFTNPLHVIWNPDHKGTIPPFFCNDSPTDYSYMQMTEAQPNEYIRDNGFNDKFTSDNSKASSNAFILGMDKGIHNGLLEWSHKVNNLSGVVYTPETVNQKVPSKCYGGELSAYEQYTANQNNRYTNNTFTTLGDPAAGYVR